MAGRLIHATDLTQHEGQIHVGIREFWIRHCIACREIGAAMGKALKNPCVTNVWIPDGYKDTPADRPRRACCSKNPSMPSSPSPSVPS